MLLLPGSTLLAVACGPQIRLYDIMASKLAHVWSNHSKTVTCLALRDGSSMDSESSSVELLAGSLDHHLKAYSLTDYKVVHSHKYSAPLLSVNVSPSGSTLAVGMSNGLLSLEPNKKAVNVAKTQSSWLTNPSAVAPRRGSRAYFMRGSSYNGKDEDLFLNSSKKRKLAAYDKYLKSFQYSAALDAALNRVSFTDIIKSKSTWKLIKRC